MYEIYITYEGKRRVNINALSFALEPNVTQQFGSKPDGRQRGLMLGGEYGETMQAYAQACAEANVPLRYAWQGVINSLGDHNSAQPPLKGKERNFRRYKFGVEITTAEEARDYLTRA